MTTTLLAIALIGCVHNGAGYACTHCARPATYATPYRAPTYAAPAAATYQAPTYNAAVAVETIFVATADHPLYSGVVGLREREAARGSEAQAGAKTLEGRVGAIEGLLARIEARLGDGAPRPATPPAPPPAPPPPPPPEMVPGGFQASPPAGGPLTTRATEILRVHCADCHTGATSKKKFVIFGDDGQLAALAPRAKVKLESRVYRGSMPPPPATMKAEDYAALRAWISQDARAIEAAQGE